MIWLEHWKAGLGSGELAFYVVVAALVATVLAWFNLYYLKLSRLIEDTPTSRIRSAAQGYVELVGAVLPGEAGQLTAPLSGTPCVWFSYEIQRYRRSGKNSHWHTIDEGASEHWFYIDDKTGKCVINPEDADVITEHKRVWYGNTKRPGNKDTGPLSLLKSMYRQRYRYIEEFIYIHDVVYALGYFQSSGGGRHLPSNHELTGEVIREWKGEYDQILEDFDQNKNGEIDMDEWEEVRKAATREAEKRRVDMAKSPTIHNLGKSPGQKNPFIISTHSQKNLAKQYRYYSVGTFVGCLVFGVVAIVLVL